MPRNKRQRHGVGAKISVYKNVLHPQASACAKPPNAPKNDVLHDLLPIGQDEKCMNEQSQGYILTWDGDFYDGQFLHSATPYYAVQQDELLESVFNESQQKSLEGGGHVVALVESKEALEVEESLNLENANFRAKGFTLEDNNQPALENIPTQIDPYIECLYQTRGSKPSFDVKKQDVPSHVVKCANDSNF